MARLARLWFLAWETPVACLITFELALGAHPTYGYSDNLHPVYIICVSMLLITSLVYIWQYRAMGALGLITVLLAGLFGPPGFVE
jgi:hypothetical protein